jgi:hypothetical protein
MPQQISKELLHLFLCIATVFCLYLGLSSFMEKQFATFLYLLPANGAAVWYFYKRSLLRQ